MHHWQFTVDPLIFHSFFEAVVWVWVFFYNAICRTVLTSRTLSSNEWKGIPVESFTFLSLIFIGPRSRFPVTCVSFFLYVPPCTLQVSGCSYLIFIIHVRDSQVTFWSGALGLGPQLPSERNKNAQVIGRFAVEPHTWIRSREIFILILDFQKHQACRIRCQAQMLDLDKMAPRCERGWMLSILTDQKKERKNF